MKMLIDGMEYEVEIWNREKELEMQLYDDLCGQCNHIKRVIGISPTRASHEVVETHIHEILHVIDRNREIIDTAIPACSEKLREYIIEQFSRGICSTIVNNKLDILKMIFDPTKLESEG